MTVHILWMGGTLCGFYWPTLAKKNPHDKWVAPDQHSGATCSECVAVFKKDKDQPNPRLSGAASV